MTDMDWWQAALDELTDETLERFVKAYEAEINSRGIAYHRDHEMIDMAQKELASRPVVQPTVVLCDAKTRHSPGRAVTCDWRLDDKGVCPNMRNHI